MFDRINLTVSERQSLRWVNSAEVFCDRRAKAARFARKLTRHSALELRALVNECRNGSEYYKYRHHRDAGGRIEGGEEDATDRGRAGHDGPRCHNGEGNSERDTSSSP